MMYPYDPFNPNRGNNDLYDPFLDPLHPLYEDRDPLGTGFPVPGIEMPGSLEAGLGGTDPSLIPYEPLSNTAIPDGPGLDPLMELESPLDMPGGRLFDEELPSPLEPSPLQEREYDILEAPGMWEFESDLIHDRIDVIDQFEASPARMEQSAESETDIRTDELLDELEASTEGQESKPVEAPMQEVSSFWPEPDSLKTGAEESMVREETKKSRATGFRRPELKLSYKSEKSFERQFKPLLWRPRQYYSKGRFSKKATDEISKEVEGLFRYCPRNWKEVFMTECEGCEYFQEGSCAFLREEIEQSGNGERSGR